MKQLKPHIDKIIPKTKWNFDFEDIDKILRIESETDIVLTIINLLKINNFHCEELE